MGSEQARREKVPLSNERWSSKHTFRFGASSAIKWFLFTNVHQYHCVLGRRRHIFRQAGELFPSLPSVRKVSWKTKDFGRLWTLCKGGQVTDADREDQVGPENEMQVEDEVQATAVGWWSADRWEEQAEDGTPRKRKTEWESKDFKYWSSSGMNLKPWVSLLAFIQNNT